MTDFPEEPHLGRGNHMAVEGDTDPSAVLKYPTKVKIRRKRKEMKDILISKIESIELPLLHFTINLAQSEK